MVGFYQSPAIKMAFGEMRKELSNSEPISLFLKRYGIKK